MRRVRTRCKGSWQDRVCTEMGIQGQFEHCKFLVGIAEGWQSRLGSTLLWDKYCTLWLLDSPGNSRQDKELANSPSSL